MIRYTAAPTVYAGLTVAALALLCAYGWIPPRFLRWGPSADKLFFGEPVLDDRQYHAMLALSMGTAMCSTFYRELMGPFWYAVVSSDAATARDALVAHMNGSVARLLVVNAE